MLLLLWLYIRCYKLHESIYHVHEILTSSLIWSFYIDTLTLWRQLIHCGVNLHIKWPIKCLWDMTRVMHSVQKCSFFTLHTKRMWKNRNVYPLLVCPWQTDKCFSETDCDPETEWLRRKLLRSWKDGSRCECMSDCMLPKDYLYRSLSSWSP